MRSKVLILAVLTAAAVVSPARADLSYAITTSQSAGAGGTTILNVYLTETVSKSSPSLLNPSSPYFDGGLGAASFGITLTSGSATITAAANNPNLPGGAGANNAQVQINSNSTAAAIVEVSTSSPPSGSQILLGTFTIAGTGTFSIGTAFAGSEAAKTQNGPAPDFLTVNNSYNLAFVAQSQLGTPNDNGYPDNVVGAYDNGQTYSVSVGVASVPEPSSMALCGLAVCGMGVGAWRRRKARLAADAEAVVAQAATEPNPCG